MNEISGQNTHEYEVNLAEYKKAIRKCAFCWWNLECRGPTPVDISCPNNKSFIPLFEILDESKF